jgi:hypothetical protein
MNTTTQQTQDISAHRALRSIEDLPTPKGLPVLGNMLQIDPPHFHLQMEQYAPSRSFFPSQATPASTESVSSASQDQPSWLKPRSSEWATASGLLTKLLTLSNCSSKNRGYQALWSA